jgi:hypothetical protein
MTVTHLTAASSASCCVAANLRYDRHVALLDLQVSCSPVLCCAGTHNTITQPTNYAVNAEHTMSYMQTADALVQLTPLKVTHLQQIGFVA